MIIGLDLGFSQVKVYAPGIKFKFPALIGIPSAFEIEQLKSNNELDNLNVAIDGSTYYVGNKALETSNAHYCTRADKTNTIFDMAEYYAALGYLNSISDISVFQIVTGLPVEEYTLKDKIQSNMTGYRSFIYNSRPTVINVPSVSVIPQSAGAYFSYILDDNGSIDEARASGRVLVIDVGYRTTDVIVMENARYISKDSFTISIGMKDIHRELIRKIKAEYNARFSMSDIDNICRDKNINLCGQLINIESIINASKKPIAEQIIEEIRYTVPDYRRMNRILACGGTMETVFDYFKQEYEGHIELMSGSEYSNAIGYYRYGIMIHKQRR